MKDPKENAFIITVEPLQSPPYSTTESTDALHGPDAMDQILSDASSDGDSESNKSITPKKKPFKLRVVQWLRTQVIKTRNSRTRQCLLAFSLVVVAVLLAVLIWLSSSGRLHEVLTVSKPGKKKRDHVILLYRQSAWHATCKLSIGNPLSAPWHAERSMCPNYFLALPALPAPLHVWLGISNLQLRNLHPSSHLDYQLLR